MISDADVFPFPYPPLLTARDIPGALGLIACVRDHLPEGKKHFLKPKTEEDLQRVLETGGAVLGIREGANRLVALTVAGREGEERAVLQSVCVHPEAGGRGYAGTILAQALAWAREQEIGHLSAKVAFANEASKRVFAAAGFTKCREGVDPDLGYPFWIVEKRMPTLDRRCGMVPNARHGHAAPFFPFVHQAALA